MASSEHWMKSWDGMEHFYRAWPAATESRKAVLLFHRGHEHSGRLEQLVADLALDDYQVFAWDARGHGRSPGERGGAVSFAVYLKDAEAFARGISARHGVPLENMAVVGHSVGGAIAAAWVHDYAPPIRALVLATPAFRVRLYVPFAVPALRLKQRLFGRGWVKSYVRARALTHDEEQVRAYEQDPAIFRQIADNVLTDLFDVSNRIVKDAGAITTPTLLLAAGSDWVVRNDTQREFFRNLSSPVKRMEILPGFRHAIFHEKERAVPISMVRQFIVEQFHSPAAAPTLLDADQRGYTRREFERLSRRSPNPLWMLERAAMRTLGRTSAGIRLGWQTGFDSGRTLDYVYANQPCGTTPIGRWIDKGYLESIGWRGIRVRKAHLESLLRRSIELVQADGKPVRILDVATGVGRYVLETLRHLPNRAEVRAVLRDYEEQNLVEGRGLARSMHLSAVTFERGDAFDRTSLSAVRPRPTIGIVSGLYELFSDNHLVSESLAGLADAIEPGGYLIYTNQPWHPQVEFIARVLTNREGKPWIMRRRTQREMDELVGAAGFEKLGSMVDGWGIFSVSLARRRAVPAPAAPDASHAALAMASR